MTEALHSLASRGLIEAGRGKIVVLDRKGVEQTAAGYYDAAGQAPRARRRWPARSIAADHVRDDCLTRRPGATDEAGLSSGPKVSLAELFSPAGIGHFLSPLNNKLPPGCPVQPPASARSRCPRPRRAGQDGGVRAAPSFATATADRLRSDRRSRWKTQPSRLRRLGNCSDGTSCTTSSGSR